MRKRLAVLTIATGLLTIAVGLRSAQAQPIYRVTVLDTPGSTSSMATAINDSGQIVGEEDFGNTTIATLFDPFAGNVQLGGVFSRALGINNQSGGGLIVGNVRVGSPTTTTTYGALFGFGGQVFTLGVDSLGSSAEDVNDAGQIVGYKDSRAVLFGNNPVNPGPDVDLGPGTAYAVNDAGLIVGDSEPPSNQGGQAALYGFGGQVINLGSLVPGGLSRASDINDVGQIVGFAQTLTGRFPNPHATLFGNNPINSGPNIDLGALGEFRSSFATAINDQRGGQLIVGGSIEANGVEQHAALWGFGGQVIDLNTRIDPDDPLFGRIELLEATDVNNAGAIVGIARIPFEISNSTHAFLLTPIPTPTPEPSALTIIGTALTGLGVLRWRFRRRYCPGDPLPRIGSFKDALK